MPENRYRILSTKELPEELLAAAAAQGLDITARSFINIKPVISDALKERIHQLLQEKRYVVFTSANAVSVILRHYMQTDGRYYYGDSFSIPPFKDPKKIEQYVEEYKKGGFYSPGWEVFCLEGATREAVQEGIRAERLFPFRNRIIATAPNATELAKQIIQQGNVFSVVFFCGNKRRNELPDMLRQHNISVEEVIIYETTEAPTVMPDAYDGILFFSPSAVKSFFSNNRIDRKTVCFAPGRTTATALQDITDNRIIISPRSSVDEMVQTAIFYFNNINCYE